MNPTLWNTYLTSDQINEYKSKCNHTILQIALLHSEFHFSLTPCQTLQQRQLTLYPAKVNVHHFKIYRYTTTRIPIPTTHDSRSSINDLHFQRTNLQFTNFMKLLHIGVGLIFSYFFKFVILRNVFVRLNTRIITKTNVLKKYKVSHLFIKTRQILELVGVRILNRDNSFWSVVPSKKILRQSHLLIAWNFIQSYRKWIYRSTIELTSSQRLWKTFFFVSIFRNLPGLYSNTLLEDNNNNNNNNNKPFIDLKCTYYTRMAAHC